MPAFCWETAAAICRTAEELSLTMLDSSLRFSPDCLTWSNPPSIFCDPRSVMLTATRMAPPMSSRISRTRLVAWIDWSASDRISRATTAKPLPCSPLRTASMAALRASILDWSARSFTVWVIPPICCVRSESCAILAAISSTCARMSVSPPSVFSIADSPCDDPPRHQRQLAQRIDESRDDEDGQQREDEERGGGDADQQLLRLQHHRRRRARVEADVHDGTGDHRRRHVDHGVPVDRRLLN